LLNSRQAIASKNTVDKNRGPTFQGGKSGKENDGDFSGSGQATYRRSMSRRFIDAQRSAISNPAAADLRGGVVSRWFRHPGHRLCRAGARQGVGPEQGLARSGVQRRPVRADDRRAGVWTACGPHAGRRKIIIFSTLAFGIGTLATSVIDDVDSRSRSGF